jgi:photosystem II stability/assembly factor-like uncharacterized protein
MPNTDKHELIPEEADEQHQHLIQDLRRMYPTSDQVAQPLAWVQQRLFHSGDGVQQDEVGPLPSQMSLRMQQARASTMNPKRKAWQRRFGALAAAVCAALLVGTLILVLNLAHQSHAGGVGTPLNQAVAITSLHMIDSTAGWALARKAVLRTTDGGNHWRDVTPPGHPLDPGSAADFFTASMAWITIPEADQTTSQLFHTSDGGHSWQQSTIQTGFVRHMTFIDAQHGWLLSGKENTAGVPAEAVSVFQTTDAGKTWQRVSAALFSDATPPGHLPYGGQKSGISFLNASTGWVTGTVLLTNVAWLYVTHDGGSTWHQQTLRLPQGIPPAQLLIQPPTFFSATDGLLPVRFSDLITSRDIATVIYVTHDGGTTWSSTMPVSAALSASHFLDVQHGWLTDGIALFVTSDGGQHWTKLTASANFKHVTQLDFVSESTGWAISKQGDGSSFLLKTTDGGQTWTQITPVIS